MSAFELAARFLLVAGIFALCMVLLRRYGKSRAVLADKGQGLHVTSRMTLGKGVQLLLVRAGRGSFLVSTGGRVTVSPVAVSPVPEFDAEAPESPAGTSVSPKGTATSPTTAIDADEADTPERNYPAGLPGLMQKWGARAGEAARHRLRRPTHSQADPQAFAAALAAATAGTEAPGEPLSAGVLAEPTAMSSAVRLDLDVTAVYAPQLPSAPSSRSALTAARPSTPAGPQRPAKARRPAAKKAKTTIGPSSTMPKGQAAPRPARESSTPARPSRTSKPPAGPVKSKTTPPAERSSDKKTAPPAARTPARSRTPKTAPVPQSGADKERKPRLGKARTLGHSVPPASEVSDPVTPAASLAPGAQPVPRVSLDLPTQGSVLA